METVIFIPKEEDFRRWVKEAVKEQLMELTTIPEEMGNDDKLISRKEVAQMLDISLVTLTDWVKRGLPCHKQRGRVYFLKSEVLDYLKRSNRS